MNALDQARRAYTAPGGPTRTLRGIEYDIFARVTARLKAAATSVQPIFSVLARALQDNRNLWSVLADDVADDNNSLPVSLRAQIFSLAEFTDQHTARILAGKAKPDVLIDINTAIMRGLRREGGPE